MPETPELDRLIRQIQPIGSQLFNRSLAFFSSTVSVALEVILIVAIALMLLINPHPYRSGFIRIFPSFYRRRVDAILTKCHESLGQWTIGTLIEMVFIAVLSGVGLWILRVPLALAHAVLAGLLNLIPNIGPTLSAVLPITIALLDAPWKAIAVLILYIVIQNIESYWLTPTIMAKQVSLLPAVTLTAQVFFASVFGPLGLLMALPLAVVAKIWVEGVLFEDVMDRWQHPGSRDRKEKYEDTA
ncbi:AI-2E family transporter [filamentous cyanobacterium CCP2]|nr:AI-2E family transporter [filamentous cyanobacterium CCP2]